MSTTLYPAPHVVVIGARAQFAGWAKGCARRDLRYFAPSDAMPAIVDGVFGTIVKDQSLAGWTFTPTKPPTARISISVKNGESQLVICRPDGGHAVIAYCDLSTGNCTYHSYTGIKDCRGYDMSNCGADAQYMLKRALSFLDFSHRAPALERAA